MSDFVPGQRWVVDTEPELGLGVVMSLDGRAVTIAFPQAECERLYARGKAPLTRIAFDVGDQVQLSDGRSAQILNVHEHGGLLIYDIGEEQLVPESSLGGAIKMNQPYLRLMTGQLDKARWFAFRRRLDAAMARVWQSHLGGLLGVRASLIPHQLYVAEQACARERVRVLLADEVGLGKTIEAGMILTRMLRFERVQRVLILVPDALQVQWLVELIRRFSVRPDIYLGAEHDFSDGQIQLAPHAVLEQPDSLLTAQQWDMVIVDEAHHLQPGTAAFTLFQTLAEASPHLVLLSATPEQLGLESHFARLQLLDPTKFVSLEQFLAAEQHYGELNRKIKALPESREQLLTQYQADPSLSDQQLINWLLDCHGLGRVMFRNTRASVQGFAGREVACHEVADDEWESKFEWLAQWAKSHPREKVLVIGHTVEQARACEDFLWRKHGIDVALFHEEMDLIERDRAAAYFADMEQGSMILVCSEIGSEGRNFQFSSHLVCLDLPEHPDLLEQRIGRLDRLGQARTVCIHVPFGRNSVTQQRLNWLHHTLNCVARQNPAASAVHDRLWTGVRDCADPGQRIALEAEAQAESQRLQAEIQAGRDALLEMNSCRQPQADLLTQKIDEFETESPRNLVEEAAQLLNFYFEETQGGAYSLLPTTDMLIPALPGIPPEGAEVTFDRELANAREDVLFLSWDAPFIIGLWEMLQHSDLGSASVALLPHKQLPAGQCLLETCFSVLIQSGSAKDCWPYLQALSVRVLVLDISDKDLSAALPEDSLAQTLKPVDKKLARRIIHSRKEQIPGWYHRAEALAAKQKFRLVDEAVEQARQYFSQEVQRLKQLAANNPNVSEDEVLALEEKSRRVQRALAEDVQLQLAAVRLIVTTEAQA